MKEKNYIKMVKYPNNDLYQSRKICTFQKVLKTTTSTQPHPPPPSPLTPTPSSSKVEGIFAPKRSSGYGCYRGPTCTYGEQPWRKVGHGFSFLWPQLFHFLVEIALSGKSK